MSSTKNSSKPKLTLADLTPVQTRITIEHPTHGDIGIWIDALPPQSIEYMSAYYEMQKVDLSKLSLADRLRTVAAVPASVVVGWNEDFFGAKCTPENVLNILSRIEYSWIMLAINAQLENPTRFFRK